MRKSKWAQMHKFLLWCGIMWHSTTPTECSVVFFFYEGEIFMTSIHMIISLLDFVNAECQDESGMSEDASWDLLLKDIKCRT